MENLIFWAALIIGGLMGLKARLLPAWLCLVNFLFSTYIALWMESAVSRFYSLPARYALYQPGLSMTVTALVVWVALLKLVDQIRPDDREFVFPTLADKLGGLACGAAAGAILIGFTMLVFVSTPQKHAIVEFASPAGLEALAISVMADASAVVDNLSMQSYSRQRRVEMLTAFQPGMKLFQNLRREEAFPAQNPGAMDDQGRRSR